MFHVIILENFNTVTLKMQSGVIAYLQNNMEEVRYHFDTILLINVNKDVFSLERRYTHMLNLFMV
jgi:hypothetical protein